MYSNKTLHYLLSKEDICYSVSLSNVIYQFYFLNKDVKTKSGINDLLNFQCLLTLLRLNDFLEFVNRLAEYTYV